MYRGKLRFMVDYNKLYPAEERKEFLSGAALRKAKHKVLKDGLTKWSDTFNNMMSKYEVDLLKKALVEGRGSISDAATICGLMRSTFAMKMGKFGLKREDFKPND